MLISNLNPFRKYYILILCLLTSELFGQPEFFNENRGLSFTYSPSFDNNRPNDFAVGGSVYFKKGFIAGLGLQKMEGFFIPSASVGIYGKQKESSLFGTSFIYSYGYFDKNHLFAMDLGVFRSFYRHSQFPFLLKGSASLEFAYATEIKYDLNFLPILGLSYIQAFLSKTYVSPFLGLNAYFVTFENHNFLSFLIGLNIKLGGKNMT